MTHFSFLLGRYITKHQGLLWYLSEPIGHYIHVTRLRDLWVCLGIWRCCFKIYGDASGASAVNMR